MHLDLSEDQELLRSTTRKFLDTACPVAGVRALEGNPAGYDNPAIVDLIAQAGAASDPAARIDLLVQAETLQAEDAINVPLWWGQSATAFAKDLGMNDYSSFAFISSWPTQLYRAGQ